MRTEDHDAIGRDQAGHLIRDDWTTAETIMFRLEHDTTAFTCNYYPASNFRPDADGFRLEVDSDPVVAHSQGGAEGFVDMHVFDFMG